MVSVEYKSGRTHIKITDGTFYLEGPLGKDDEAFINSILETQLKFAQSKRVITWTLVAWTIGLVMGRAARL